MDAAQFARKIKFAQRRPAIEAPLKWFERKFNFQEPVEIYPALVERLRGTPSRLPRYLHDLDDAKLSTHIDGKWSIKENIGHLTDLESLWQSRLADYQAGRDMLSPADLQNRKTHEAGHNARSAPELVAQFAAVRDQFVSSLSTLDATHFALRARHPRLNVPMRLLDLCLFVAEHDDHHIALIHYNRSRLL